MRDIKFMNKIHCMDTIQETKKAVVTKPLPPSQLPLQGAGGLSGSQAVLEALIAEGVETVFGYPGGAIMPIYEIGRAHV